MCTEIANKIKCSSDTVRKVLKARGINPNINKTNKFHKVIIQYDSAGNKIQEFGGSLKAADWLVSHGKSKSQHSASNHIIDCCLGKQKKCGGYVWRYK